MILDGEEKLAEEIKSRIESEIEVKSYIQDLKFALNNGAKIDFQAKRLVDVKRDERYTNQYTVNKLFPDENPVDALKKELLTLSVEDYMKTVRTLDSLKEVKCVNSERSITEHKMYILK